MVRLNGGDKVLMSDWWGKLWWNELEGKDPQFKDIVSSRMRGAMVRFVLRKPRIGIWTFDWKYIPGP